MIVLEEEKNESVIGRMRTFNQAIYFDKRYCKALHGKTQMLFLDNFEKLIKSAKEKYGIAMN